MDELTAGGALEFIDEKAVAREMAKPARQRYEEGLANANAQMKREGRAHRKWARAYKPSTYNRKRKKHGRQ